MCEGDGGEVATAGGRDDDHQHPRRDPRVGGRVRCDAEEAVGHRVAGSGRPLCQLYLLDCRGHRGHARRQRHAGMFGRIVCYSTGTITLTITLTLTENNVTGADGVGGTGGADGVGYCPILARCLSSTHIHSVLTTIFQNEPGLASCPLILLLRLFFICASFWDRPKHSMSSLTQSHRVFFRAGVLSV